MVVFEPFNEQGPGDDPVILRPADDAGPVPDTPDGLGDRQFAAGSHDGQCLKHVPPCLAPVEPPIWQLPDGHQGLTDAERRRVGEQP